MEDNIFMANKAFGIKDYKKAYHLYIREANRNLQKYSQISLLYNAGVCLIPLKEFKKALSCFKFCAKYEKKQIYIFNLAYCNLRLHNNQKALRYFNMAWAMKSDDTECEKAINMILNNLRKENAQC